MTWSLAQWRAGCTTQHVHDDWTTAKPREECQPFTFTLDAGTPTRSPNVQAQEKFVKALDRLRAKEVSEAKKRAAAERRRVKAGGGQA